MTVSIKIDPTALPRLVAADRSPPIGFVAYGSEDNQFVALDSACQRLGTFRGAGVVHEAVRRHRAAEGRHRRRTWPEVVFLKRGTLPELRIARREIGDGDSFADENNDFLELRVWITPREGKPYPTIAGLVLPFDQLETVIAALAALRPNKVKAKPAKATPKATPKARAKTKGGKAK